MIKRMLKNRKGQGFVEYSLLVAGIALVGTLGVTFLGIKTNHLISAMAVTMPGPNDKDNDIVQPGAMLEIKKGTTGLLIDFEEIQLNTDGTQHRLNDNITGENETNDGLDLAIENVWPDVN